MEEKEIFILGAGFSRAIAGDSMPLLHELTKEISEGITSGADNDIKNIYVSLLEKLSSKLNRGE